MKKRLKLVLDELKLLYPDAKIELNYEGVWQLIVAVILSAQCTDKRVNMVTPALFARFGCVEDFANCDIEELERLIFSTGFYRSKAKNIKKAAQMVMSEFGGKVPDTMEGLLSLPGVARKTANVVLWCGFEKAEGVVVDTHVMRVCGLIGMVSKRAALKKNAVVIEKELMEVLAKEEWGGFSHLIILHGRRVCIARKPRCGACSLAHLCEFGRKSAGRVFGVLKDAN